MTKVCYEPTKGGPVNHITRDDKKTICGQRVQSYQGAPKHDRTVEKLIFCKKCWVKYNG